MKNIFSFFLAFSLSLPAPFFASYGDPEVSGDQEKLIKRLDEITPALGNSSNSRTKEIGALGSRISHLLERSKNPEWRPITGTELEALKNQINDFTTLYHVDRFSAEEREILNLSRDSIKKLETSAKKYKKEEKQVQFLFSDGSNESSLKQNPEAGKIEAASNNIRRGVGELLKRGAGSKENIAVAESLFDNADHLLKSNKDYFDKNPDQKKQLQGTQKLLQNYLLVAQKLNRCLADSEDQRNLKARAFESLSHLAPDTVVCHPSEGISRDNYLESLNKLISAGESLGGKLTDEEKEERERRQRDLHPLLFNEARKIAKDSKAEFEQAVGKKDPKVLADSVNHAIGDLNEKLKKVQIHAIAEIAAQNDEIKHHDWASRALRRLQQSWQTLSLRGFKLGLGVGRNADLFNALVREENVKIHEIATQNQERREAALKQAIGDYVQTYVRYASDPKTSLLLTNALQDKIGRQLSLKDKGEFDILGFNRHGTVEKGDVQKAIQEVQKRFKQHDASISKILSTVDQPGGTDAYSVTHRLKELIKISPQALGLVLVKHPELAAEACGLLREIAGEDERATRRDEINQAMFMTGGLVLLGVGGAGPFLFGKGALEAAAVGGLALGGAEASSLGAKSVEEGNKADAIITQAFANGGATPAEIQRLSQAYEAAEVNFKAALLAGGFTLLDAQALVALRRADLAKSIQNSGTAASKKKLIEQQVDELNAVADPFGKLAIALVDLPLDRAERYLRSHGVRIERRVLDKTSEDVLHILPDGEHPLNKFASSIRKIHGTDVMFRRLPSGVGASFRKSQQILFLPKGAILDATPVVSSVGHEAIHSKNYLLQRMGIDSPYHGDLHVREGEIPLFGNRLNETHTKHAYAKRLSLDEILANAYSLNTSQTKGAELFQGPESRWSLQVLVEGIRESMSDALRIMRRENPEDFLSFSKAGNITEEAVLVRIFSEQGEKIWNTPLHPYWRKNSQVAKQWEKITAELQSAQGERRTKLLQEAEGIIRNHLLPYLEGRAETLKKIADEVDEALKTGDIHAPYRAAKKYVPKSDQIRREALALDDAKRISPPGPIDELREARDIERILSSRKGQLDSLAQHFINIDPDKIERAAKAVKDQNGFNSFVSTFNRPIRLEILQKSTTNYLVAAEGGHLRTTERTIKTMAKKVHKRLEQQGLADIAEVRVTPEAYAALYTKAPGTLKEKIDAAIAFCEAATRIAPEDAGRSGIKWIGRKELGEGRVATHQIKVLDGPHRMLGRVIEENGQKILEFGDYTPNGFHRSDSFLGE